MNLVQWLPVVQLLASASVLIFALFLIDRAKGAKRRAEGFQDDLEKSLQATLAVLTAPAGARQEPGAAGAAGAAGRGSGRGQSRSSAPAAATAPKQMSQLDRTKELRQTELTKFRQELQEWARIARVRLDSVTPVEDELDKFAVSFRNARDINDLSDTGREFLVSASKAVYDLLRKSDLAVDKLRQNPRLQDQLGLLLKLTGVTAIDAHKGDPVNSSVHETLRPVSRSARDRSGTIAAVEVRGLRQPNGEVFRKAEILEFE
jgi:hypothetical protein